MSGDMAFSLLVVLFLVEMRILLFDFLECVSLLQDIFWLNPCPAEPGYVLFCKQCRVLFASS